jgi:cytochrome c-type biogenesis protein CcmH/NrfG
MLAQSEHIELMARAARLEGYAALDRDNAALQLDLAQTYHRAGEHERALQVIDASPAGAGNAALRGQLLLALGRWHEAELLFEAALRDAPDSPALLFNLGYSVWAAGDRPARAAELFRQATLHDPQSVQAHCHLALALEAQADAAGADAALAQALTLEPNHLKALAMRARLELDAGHLQAAAHWAGRCVAAHPAASEGWQLKGQVALFQTDAEAAAKALRQALALDPQDIDTSVLLAQASLMLGRVRYARRLLEQVLARDPGDDANECLLGWACIADNDIAGARRAFDAGIAIDPDNPDALAGAASVRLANGERAEAEELAQRALALDPQHVVARLIVAQMHEAGGRAQDARATLESVLASTPFGPLRGSVAQTMQAAKASHAARRLQRRFSRGALPAEMPAQTTGPSVTPAEPHRQ